MAQKCVHKGCGKKFTDETEECVYHPGPPVFHEGQKGWSCCKPRVLTFDEFLEIPPCTTGTHSAIDDTPKPESKPKAPEADGNSLPAAPRIALSSSTNPNTSIAAQPTASTPAPPPPETDDDDPSLEIPAGKTCRRRGCNSSYDPAKGREGEKCTYHPGHPIFHEGTKGWTCCKKRVLDFDEFLGIEGCETKNRHLFIGKGRKENKEEEKIDAVKTDFYQTTTTVYASLFLKKITAEKSTVSFKSEDTVSVDLVTAENKRYQADIPLYGHIMPEESKYKVLGTKLELELKKKDGAGWPVLKATDRLTGEIIQSGRAGRV